MLFSQGERRELKSSRRKQEVTRVCVCVGGGYQSVHFFRAAILTMFNCVSKVGQHCNVTFQRLKTNSTFGERESQQLNTMYSHYDWCHGALRTTAYHSECVNSQQEQFRTGILESRAAVTYVCNLSQIMWDRTALNWHKTNNSASLMGNFLQIRGCLWDQWDKQNCGQKFDSNVTLCNDTKQDDSWAHVKTKRA